MDFGRRAALLLGAVVLATAAIPPGGARAAKQDPFENFYGNTLVCIAAERGNDLCHTWVNRDGTFITFDPTGMHKGHWRRGPTRPDGKAPICWYDDSTLMVLPPEVMGPMGPPKPASSGSQAGGVVCDTRNYRTTCNRYQTADGLSSADQARLKMTIVERFHAGMCYPLPVKHVGDTWYEDDDPLPGENALDRLLLLKGHR